MASTWDVVVVGAGLTGCLAARSLTERGHRVLTVDAGPQLRGRPPRTRAAFDRQTKPLLKIDAARWAYRSDRRSHVWQRVRAVGGRTLLWGGWLDAPDGAYFTARAASGHPWPIELTALAPSLAAASHMLGATQRPLDPRLAALAANGWSVAAKIETFTAGLQRPATALQLARGLRVRSAAAALQVTIDVHRQTRGVLLRTEDGIVDVRAKAVVLAASPVESARILHQSPRVPGVGLGSALHDHLVAGAIAIGRGRVHATSDEPGRRAAGGRILPTATDTERMTVEIRGPRPLTDLDNDDLDALGFTRRGAAQHHFFAVFALAETDPAAHRSVSFDSGHRDALGRPLPSFQAGKLTAAELALGRTMRQRVMQLSRLLAGTDGLAFLVQDARDPLAAGHECGTCPMGSADRATVATDGAVHGVDGLYVADASALPGATDRHPSLTIAAWSLHVVDAADRWLRDA